MIGRGGSVESSIQIVGSFERNVPGLLEMITRGAKRPLIPSIREGAAVATFVSGRRDSMPTANTSR